MLALFPGRVVARKYQVLSRVGVGREGELYMLSECATGIERTGKFFYPHANRRGSVSRYHAQKLHRFRHCNVLMQYRTQETICLNGQEVTFLVSDLAQGELLTTLLEGKKTRRFSIFEGLHLLDALAKGVEPMHAAGEHHGSLKLSNVLVTRHGLGFDVKLLDLEKQRGKRTSMIHQDVKDLVRMYYDVTPGAHPESASLSAVRRSLKSRAAAGEFKDASELRRFLQTLDWEAPH